MVVALARMVELRAARVAELFNKVLVLCVLLVLGEIVVSYAAVEFPEKLALTMLEAILEATEAAAEEREEAFELRALVAATELIDAATEDAREAAELMGLLTLTLTLDCAVAEAARPRRATILNCILRVRCDVDEIESGSV